MKTLAYTASFNNGDIPDAVPVNQKFSDVATLINSTKLDPDNLNNGTAGQLIVCGATGAPAYKAMGGDGRLDSSGNLTLAAEYHEANASATMGLTTTFAQPSGLSFTATKSGVFLVTANVPVHLVGSASSTGPQTFTAILVAAFVTLATGSQSAFNPDLTGMQFNPTIPLVTLVNLSAGTSLAVQAKCSTSLAFSTLQTTTDATLTAVRVA